MSRKEYMREYMKKRRLENPDEAKRITYNWRNKNKEKYNNYMREYMRERCQKNQPDDEV